MVMLWNMPAGRFIETLPAMITIAEPGQIGVHATKEPQKMFNFGTTFPGTKVQKNMNLTRGKESPARVNITINGPIKSWILLDKNDFILDEPTKVEVTIAVPDDAGIGTYSGNITIDYTSTYGMRALDMVGGGFNLTFLLDLSPGF